MFMNRIRLRSIVGLWLLALVAIGSVSTAVGASGSTTALLLLLAATPMGIALLLGFSGGRTMTTHELLYAVENPRAGARGSLREDQ
jgi:hypothetical protein